MIVFFPSFFKKGLPISAALCSGIVYMARTSLWKPRFYHYFGAIFLGYFGGKFSYRSTCEEKLINSKSNSPFVNAIRKRRGLFIEGNIRLIFVTNHLIELFKFVSIQNLTMQIKFLESQLSQIGLCLKDRMESTSSTMKTGLHLCRKTITAVTAPQITHQHFQAHRMMTYEQEIVATLKMSSSCQRLI